MKKLGQRHDFSIMGLAHRESTPTPEAPVIIDLMLHELENAKLAAGYAAAAIAMDQYFEQTGKQRPEDVQF